MQQQTLELHSQRTASVLTGVANAVPDGDSAGALARLLDEAERVVVARIALDAVPRRVEPEERSQRVRYAYD